MTALRFDLSTCFTCGTKIAGIVSPAGDQEGRQRDGGKGVVEEGEGGQRQSHKYDVFVLRVAASKCACHTRHAAELTLFRQVQQAGEAEGTEGGAVNGGGVAACVGLLKF